MPTQQKTSERYKCDACLLKVLRAESASVKRLTIIPVTSLLPNEPYLCVCGAPVTFYYHK